MATKLLEARYPVSGMRTRLNKVDLLVGLQCLTLDDVTIGTFWTNQRTVRTKDLAGFSKGARKAYKMRGLRRLRLGLAFSNQPKRRDMRMLLVIRAFGLWFLRPARMLLKPAKIYL